MESLKRARKDSGLSLAQLAQRIGLHPVSLARAERRGKDVKASTVVAVAKALGMHTCELLEDKEDHERHRRKRKTPKR